MYRISRPVARAAASRRLVSSTSIEKYSSRGPQIPAFPAT
jgi:hypothetical protein